MSDFYVLNIDVKGSSGTDLPSHDTARVWQVSEDLLRFLSGNEGINPEPWFLWAGDGGFLLVEDSDGSNVANKVLRIAEWFTAQASHFLNREYLDCEIQPVKFRVCIGRVVAKFPAQSRRRISNLAGPDLSLLLKYERDFGRVGHISVWEDAYNQLGPSQKPKFRKRSGLVHGKAVYDAPVPQKKTDNDFVSLVLGAKNAIDSTSVEYLHDELARARAENSRSLEDAIGEAFTPLELFSEILKKTAVALHKAHSSMHFRVAYAQRFGDALEIRYWGEHELDEGKRPKHRIPLTSPPGTGNYTARLAFEGCKTVFVPSTAEELKKPAAERQFDKTHDEQDLSTIASILCMPVKSDSRDGKHPKAVHGVLCVDTPQDGYFDEARADSFREILQSLVLELSLAEMIDGLLTHFRRSRGVANKGGTANA